MNDKIFLTIKEEYDKFYRSLLKKGRLPMWSTEKGFWNSSITDDLYETFKKINLHKFKSFLDIGSGDGKVVLIASLFCKNAEGIEIDDFLHNKYYSHIAKHSQNIYLVLLFSPMFHYNC